MARRRPHFYREYVGIARPQTFRRAAQDRRGHGGNGKQQGRDNQLTYLRSPRSSSRTTRTSGSKRFSVTRKLLAMHNETVAGFRLSPQQRRLWQFQQNS